MRGIAKFYMIVLTWYKQFCLSNPRQLQCKLQIYILKAATRQLYHYSNCYHYWKLLTNYSTTGRLNSEIKTLN